MTLLITLSIAGSDTGPFNLYSDVDGFTSAFEVGVAKIDLLMGYTSYVVPNGTSIVRVMSNGDCKNYIDLTVNVTTTTTSTDPPVPPFTTTTKIPCFCYNLTGIGEYEVDWIDCDGVPQNFKLSNFDVNICAQQDSFIYSGGDGSLVVTGGTLPCASDLDCTTTTTTTATPSYSFELVYDDTSCANACAGLVTTTYYSADPVLGAASVLYTDSGLTTPAINGFYSDSVDCFTVIDGLGTIDSVSSCSL